MNLLDLFCWFVLILANYAGKIDFILNVKEKKE